MPEIDYKNLTQHLNTLEKKEPAPVYLFWGEEFLYKTALEEFLDRIFTSSEKRLNYEAMDDNNENIHDIIERINTYSLLSGPRVVALKDAKIFYSSLDIAAFFEKARTAYDSNDIKKASKYILSLMGKLNLTYEDLADKANRKVRLKYDAGIFGDDAWLEKIIDNCMETRLMIPPALDNADLLQRAIEKGLPRGNHLVVTTDMVDKRRTLYKSILKVGTVVNCSVPKGDRRADKTAQREVLNDQLRVFLTRAGKTIQKEAFDCLVEMTGFDLRTFTSNLEKLISFVGDRTEISSDDVKQILDRTKKDPLYELTNSVAERNILDAIFFLDSLLSDNFHPLQILAAISNQVRKLLVIRDFMESPHGKSWQGPKTNYQRFRDAVMPAMQLYDKDNLDRLDEWDRMTAAAEPDEAAKPSKKKDKTKTDLGIVKNPQNPYPVFQMAQRAHGFSLRELQAAMETLSDADLQMKSTPKNPRLILEKVIFSICQQPVK
ncbi:MAG: hypothetical protein P1P89_07735 [Desulfobacterales bacterium]|nr:hypothetical protein [Desulfobacterales bacterium]